MRIVSVVHCITYKLFLLSICFSSFLYFLNFISFLGYQKFVDPGISPEFEAAAIRLGITMAPPGVYMRYCSFFSVAFCEKSELIQNPHERHQTVCILYKKYNDLHWLSSVLQKQNLPFSGDYQHRRELITSHASL